MECGQDLELLMETRWDMHRYMIFSYDVIARAHTHAHLDKPFTALEYHILLKENFSRFQNRKLHE